MLTVQKALLFLCIVALASLVTAEEDIADELKRDERSANLPEPDHRRPRGFRKRHDRERREEVDSGLLREIFNVPTDQHQQPPVRRNVGNDYYSQLQNYIQRSLYAYQYGQPQTPYFNPFFPTGYQANNFNPQCPPYPWSGGQSQVIYVPIIFAPFPQAPAGQPGTGQKPEGPSIDDRFNFEGPMSGQPTATNPPPSNVDPDEYYRPITGISLEPVAPLRPPSRPAPPIAHSSSNTNQNSGPYAPASNQAPNQNSGFRPNTRPTSRPAFRPAQAPTTQRPNFNTNNQIDNDEPSSCVKAIVNCCLGANTNENAVKVCFERNSCGGAFFDGNPCDTSLARAAEQTVYEFRTRGNFGK